MSANINRSLSMMPGSGDAPASVPAAGIGGGRNRRNSFSSPLQIFVKAKKKINEIFAEIGDYVLENIRFINAAPQEKKVWSEEYIKAVNNYNEKIHGIQEILARDHMKVAFFGRTSNGKSTVINAMLQDKVLPSGIGHTTNCFLHVEGSENGESYLTTEDSTERKNVKSVSQLAHALCQEKLGESALVKVFWPKEKCLLLRDDVVLVDSPGIDVSPNLDDWIDKHCLDADVFVLVANAESTLMLTEKNFFHKVSSRLSKPNIFILHNRWDASASEDFLEEVKKQHHNRAVEFLVEELKVCTRQQAEDRIFFVSAKEALQARLQEQKGLPPHAGAVSDNGFYPRLFDFQEFEKKFEECISKSAVQTKFEQHTQRGKIITSELEAMMNSIYENTGSLKSEKFSYKKELIDKLDFIEKQLELLTQEMKDKIQLMVEDVEQRVSKALSEEIRRLSVLVDEFSVPFHSDDFVLNVYKKELHGYIETGLGSNLRSRLSTALAMNIENCQKEMTERMSALLPSEKQLVSQNILPRREPFEVLYCLNCENLCADFREDIEFRFSLGLTALINRFTGRQGNRMTVMRYTELIPRPSVLTPQTPSNEPKFLVQQKNLSLFSSLALSSFTSQGTMGSCLVGGFLLKSVGWRFIIISGVLYGCLYLYERLTWTNSAKEREFKRQYVEHASRKLRLIVDLTSANCSHQVQQELSSTFARLCHLVDEATNEMKSDVRQYETEIKVLDDTASCAKVLRNKANYLINKLDMFEQTYLKLED